MGEAARVANERIDTANRGKKMLDDGGPDVELKLRCKRQCRKTVEDDGKQVRALDQLARDYDDAISKLKASLTTEALQPTVLKKSMVVLSLRLVKRSAALSLGSGSFGKSWAHASGRKDTSKT